MSGLTSVVVGRNTEVRVHDEFARKGPVGEVVDNEPPGSQGTGCEPIRAKAVVIHDKRGKRSAADHAWNARIAAASAVGGPSRRTTGSRSPLPGPVGRRPGRDANNGAISRRDSSLDSAMQRTTWPVPMASEASTRKRTLRGCRPATVELRENLPRDVPHRLDDTRDVAVRETRKDRERNRARVEVFRTRAQTSGVPQVFVVGVSIDRKVVDLDADSATPQGVKDHPPPRSSGTRTTYRCHADSAPPGDQAGRSRESGRSRRTARDGAPTVQEPDSFFSWLRPRASGCRSAGS